MEPGATRRVRGVSGAPDVGRTLVMGILNVTPDSFSDGGDWFSGETAVRHGLELAEQGADIVDVGGESTRPGAERVDEDEESRRVVPVIRELAGAGVFVSVDTMRAEVARAAVDAGARLVNDVSGGLADPSMLPVIAESGVPCVLMHWRGHSRDMQSRAVYGDVVDDVIGELAGRVDAAVEAGIDRDAIVVDPGLGFAKYARHNWELLARLADLGAAGPVLVGASRKKFLGQLLAAPDGTPRPAKERDDASLAVATIAGTAGVWGVRIHAVRGAADAVRVATAWRDRQEGQRTEKTW